MRAKLSYANVMATLAVFIALGGASYAALKLPKNSVGSEQIRKNAVKSPKVKDHSLLAKDFKAGQLPAGRRGAAGPKGAPGPKGAAGSDAFGELVYKQGATVAVPNGTLKLVSVSCGRGYYPIGGGVRDEASLTGADMTGSFPSDGGGVSPGTAGWTTEVIGASGLAAQMDPFVVCAKAGKVSGP